MDWGSILFEQGAPPIALPRIFSPPDPSPIFRPIFRLIDKAGRIDIVIILRRHSNAPVSRSHFFHT